jgi:hypothetical protein
MNKNNLHAIMANVITPTETSINKEELTYIFSNYSQLFKMNLKSSEDNEASAFRSLFLFFILIIFLGTSSIRLAKEKKSYCFVESFHLILPFFPYVIRHRRIKIRCLKKYKTKIKKIRIYIVTFLFFH